MKSSYLCDVVSGVVLASRAIVISWSFELFLADGVSVMVVILLITGIG